MFSSRRFMVSGLTFRSLIYFEFIFVYDIRECSNFILLHVAIELPYDPAIPLLVIYLKKTKTLIRKDTHTPMFTAALFTIAKMWRKQAKCPSTDEWIKKMWYVYTYKGVLLSPKRE